jgi:myo-inositol-1(or 4)-monophosphatase
MGIDLEAIRNTGIGAAYRSAEILNSRLGRLTAVRKKGPTDLVTEADIESEKQIIQAIRARFPDHEILAEETGLNKKSASRYKWIIDPLDGTTNFAHGLPLFSISIAFAVEDETATGIVLNPVTGELFCAVSGKGATLNGRPIRVSGTGSVANSLLVTGFPYDAASKIKPLISRFEACLSAAGGIRRLGSAALDLCFVACGRFDGFWEESLKPWDTAAGALIAKEDGAVVTDFHGSPYQMNDIQILATNGLIHEEMRSLLKAGQTVARAGEATPRDEKNF